MSLPKAVEELSFQAILDRKKAKLRQLAPTIANQLVDSDPAIALLEESTYTEGLLRNKQNQNLLAVMVQYASGSDLDNLGLLYNVTRKLIQEEDNSIIPPTPAIWENDENLRKRILEAPQGFSVAGPESAYIYYGKLADAKVKDISSRSPEPCNISIAVLSYDGDGTASEELVQKVANQLNDEEIRPLGDRVTVRSAEIINFEVKLKLEIENTPNIPMIIEEVKNNIQNYVNSQHKLVGVMAISGIYASCHAIEGVKRVILESPSADIETQDYQAPYCTNIEVSLYEGESGGSDEPTS